MKNGLLPDWRMTRAGPRTEPRRLSYRLWPRARLTLLVALLAAIAWAVLAGSEFTALLIPPLGMLLLVEVARSRRAYSRLDVFVYSVMSVASVYTLWLRLWVDRDLATSNINPTFWDAFAFAEVILFAGLIGNAIIWTHNRRLSRRLKVFIMCIGAAVLGPLSITPFVVVAFPLVFLTACTLLSHHWSEVTLPQDKWV